MDFNLEVVKEIPFPQFPFYFSNFISDKEFIVGGQSNFCFIIDIWGNPIREIDTGAYINSSCSFNDQVLVIGNWGSCSMVYNRNTFENIFKIEGHRYANSVLCLKDSILVSGQEGQISEWSNQG